MSEHTAEVLSEEVLSEEVLPEIVPVVDLSEHAIANELWEALESEIHTVVTKIDSGEELAPEDVKRAQSLRRQVENHTDEFKRTMVRAQKGYQSEVAKRLQDLGYNRIETYVQGKRNEQTAEQNARLTLKMDTLTEIVQAVTSETNLVKDTSLAPGLTTLFTARFPNVKSAAKTKEINDWEPYRQVIHANLTLVDAFLMDERYADAWAYPVYSKTMQQITKYLRDGDIEHMTTMKEAYDADQSIREDLFLRENVTTKAQTLALIGELASGDTGDINEVLLNIARLVAYSTTLQS